MNVSVAEALHTYVSDIRAIYLTWCYHTCKEVRKNRQNYSLSMVKYVTTRRNQRKASGPHKQSMWNIQLGNTNGLSS